MERQYVGARYVPVFAEPLEWDNQRSFERLTIVSYLGGSYTSKKDVPSGILPTNTEYWAQTGNYNAQVEEYRQEVNTLINTIKSVGKTIFITDSYGATSNWAKQAASSMGLSVNEYWEIGLNGGGFAEGTSEYGWLNKLMIWVSEHQNEVPNIKNIICGGGINDSIRDRTIVLFDKIKEFRNYVINTFPTDTKIYLAYFGWCLDESDVIGGRNGEAREIARNIYSRCSEAGDRIYYLTGCEYAVHDRTLMNADGLHPNDVGGVVIGGAVANSFIKGNAETNKPRAISVVEPISGSFTGFITNSINSGMITVEVSLEFTNMNLELNNTTATEIGNVSLRYVNHIPKWETVCRINTSEGIKEVPMMFQLTNNKLYAQILASGVSYNPVNVSAIYRTVGTMVYTAMFD